MKRFVNGQEIELQPTGVEIVQLPDRLIVHTEEGAKSAVVVRQGDTVLISYDGRSYEVEKATRSKSIRAGSGEIKAPMPGLIVDVLVVEGQTVKKGDRLVVLEAMKTQQPFSAPFDGRVAKIGVITGQQVKDLDLMVLVEPVVE